MSVGVANALLSSNVENESLIESLAVPFLLCNSTESNTLSNEFVLKNGDSFLIASADFMPESELNGVFELLVFMFEDIEKFIILFSLSELVQAASDIEEADDGPDD